MMDQEIISLLWRTKERIMRILKDIDENSLSSACFQLGITYSELTDYIRENNLTSVQQSKKGKSRVISNDELDNIISTCDKEQGE
jgi:molybdenum-dependent DNA-binding transcriptional regulator ModE